jgi:hypothetical protein
MECAFPQVMTSKKARYIMTANILLITFNAMLVATCGVRRCRHWKRGTLAIREEKIAVLEKSSPTFRNWFLFMTSSLMSFEKIPTFPQFFLLEQLAP